MHQTKVRQLQMQDPYFFGYGSLVNTRTHAYGPTHQAKAQGWRRAWRATELRQLSFLTAVRDAGCAIDGLIAPVPNADWAALDLREAAYDRHTSEHEIAHQSTASDIAIYAINHEAHFPPTDDHPILLSYLDVVVQGYLAEFGVNGAEHFFATTSGWEAPFLNDRAAPKYPRAQRLSDAERSYVDDALCKLGSRMLSV